MTGLNEKTAKALRRYLAHQYPDDAQAERSHALLEWRRDLMADSHKGRGVSIAFMRKRNREWAARLLAEVRT